MRKNNLKKILALAFCSLGCLAMGTVSLLTTNEAQAAEGVKITQTYTLSGFRINEKAAIRRDERLALRFTTEVDEDMQANVKRILGGGNIVYGTLLLPEDLLLDEELTHNTPSVICMDVAASEWDNDTKYTVIFGEEGNQTLDESYYSRPIVARSYALNKDTGVVYYTENTAVRSIGYVASKAVDDGDISEAVQAIASHSATTKELVLYDNISAHNSVNEGTNVIANGVNNQSKNLFVFLTTFLI